MSTTNTDAVERLKDDTEALLRMFSDGGSMAGLYGLSDAETEALYAFGLGYYQQRKYVDAQKVFAQLVALRHGEPRYLNALAAAHQMLGQHDRAVHFYGVSQLLDPSDPVPTFHTAHSLLALGLVDDAKDALDLVVAQAQAPHSILREQAQALLELVSRRVAAAGPH